MNIFRSKDELNIKYKLTPDKIQLYSIQLGNNEIKGSELQNLVPNDQTKRTKNLTAITNSLQGKTIESVLMGEPIVGCDDLKTDTSTIENIEDYPESEAATSELSNTETIGEDDSYKTNSADANSVSNVDLSPMGHQNDINKKISDAAKDINNQQNEHKPINLIPLGEIMAKKQPFTFPAPRPVPEKAPPVPPVYNPVVSDEKGTLIGGRRKNRTKKNRKQSVSKKSKRKRRQTAKIN